MPLCGQCQNPTHSNASKEQSKTAHSVTMTDALEPHEVAHARLEHILEHEEPAVLARKLGQRLTISPMIVRAIVADMNQNFEIPDGKTAVEVIVSQMLTVLLGRAQLEIRSIEGHSAAELQVFPFGFENQAISFPFQILRYDWEAMACLQRFQLQGRCNNNGARIFHRDHVTSDRTRVTYSRFAYNAVLGNAMLRTAFLATYLTVYAAQAFEKQNCDNVEERSSTAIEHTRILMQDCLEHVAQRLAQIVANPRERGTVPSLTPLMRTQVRELIEICGDKKRFSSAVLVHKAVEFARQQLRAGKEKHKK